MYILPILFSNLQEAEGKHFLFVFSFFFFLMAFSYLLNRKRKKKYYSFIQHLQAFTMSQALGTKHNSCHHGK